MNEIWCVIKCFIFISAFWFCIFYHVTKIMIFEHDHSCDVSVDHLLRPFWDPAGEASLSGFQVTCSAVWHSLGGRDAASVIILAVDTLRNRTHLNTRSDSSIQSKWRSHSPHCGLCKWSTHEAPSNAPVLRKNCKHRPKMKLCSAQTRRQAFRFWAP